MEQTLGIIGGSGLYALEGLSEIEEIRVATPFGAPSDAVIRGKLGPVTLLFLPRHGRGHRLAPHRINYRANVFALKALGAQQVLSVSAVGSLDESLHPGDFVLVDQLIDRTRGRQSTFFDDFDMVAHVGFGDPVDAALAAASREALARISARVHVGGTYVCMDGPQFSTRAESELYRSWGASVIGMTNLPEAKLAREAELPYATVAMVTDYDCWREGVGEVDASAILEVMRANLATARSALRHLAKALPAEREASPIDTALDTAVVTPFESWSAEAKVRLGAVAGRYMRLAASPAPVG